MIKQIRNSKFTKVVAWYLALMIFVEITQPIHMYALTSGPTQPEFNSFTPIGTSDMVDLASGDFNYNIPIMDVGGYPLNLSYNAGITTDQEASWVGLGWNLNVGQIERQVRGLPDDFRGDLMQYENDLRENITVGTHFGFNAAFAGYDAFKPGVGLGVQYNNYEGITFKPSFGLSFQLSENVAVGLNFTGSATEGASVNPTVSISAKLKEKFDSNTTSESLKGTGTIGLGFSSRKGVENLNLSASVKRMSNLYSKTEKGETQVTSKTKALGALGGSVSFNDMSYTPSKRVGFENTSFTFNGAFGSEFFLTEFQGQISGYGSYQKVASQYRNRKEKAFGYENTEYKRSQAGVMDFNRENERTVTENTTALPVTNYTYDIYNIDGQGVSGMFRPYRSQVSYLYNDKVTDYGEGASLGVEFGIGNIAHTGVDFKVAPSTSTTGGWVSNNNVLQYFNESSTDTKKMEYEPVTYKLVGSTVVDPEQSIYLDKIHKEKALRIGLDGGTKNRMTTNRYYEGYNGVSHVIDSKIKRTKRYLRNQLVHKVTAEETAGDPFVIKNDSAKVHHTAGIKVLQTDGSTYVYGRTAYNMRKVEATFDVSGQTGNNTNGLVPYNGTTSGNHTSRSDKFLNKITTPPYAHSYLITSVLSADYEDVDGNGPSLNDLGTFTKFDYRTVSNYKWRIPFQANTATYNEGLISHKDDQKGTYLYGIKELTYLDKISTKTHVAFFDLEDRQDAVGVAGEQGGVGSGRMKYIKSIRLYSRPEVTNASGNIFDPGINSAIKPIKTAHFDYDYSLCKNTPNSLADGKGKLTLKRVYFTYRDSNMGRYTPYVFHYGLEKSKNKPDNYTIDNDLVNNPNYDPKGFDIWGNYKVNPAGSGNLNSALSNTEYPFVDQGNQQTADNNTGAWTLKSVQLPSGGVIAIETESDDYQYVQNKRAMQMFKVAGAGSTKNPGSGDITNTLYNENGHKKYLYIKLDDASGINSRQDFIDNYLRENLDKAIQFRFLMNMTANDSQYEYVSGYFEIGETDTQKINVVTNVPGYGKVVAIPLKMLNRDGSSGPENVNPIAKTGWGFGRTYLNRIVYSIGGDNSNTNFVSIVNDLLGSIESISKIFDGPNRELERKGCARIFKTDKSWIRLENSKGRKLGGGLRVKSIRLSDEWGSMLSSTQSGGTDLSSMEYGQTYSYDDDGDSKGNNKKSSGVATYEPNGSAENALLEPLYPKSGSYAQNISAPKENNYVEKPFGENFFPAPRVTYSKVTVQNLPRKEGNKEVKRHATGKVVTRHYTSYDFPTKVDFTDPDVKSDIPSPNQLMGFVTQLVSFMVRSHLTMSQGYSVETNDMNGKVKSQEVYAEGNNQPISKVVYKYNVDANGNLDNYLQTINKNGEVKRQLLGVDYDMINDFNESRSESELAGFDGNLGAFIFTLFPGFVPTILPKYSYNENLLRTAVTTKHVHKTGILVEKIAYDLGSSVSTKNLAWDASSGEVILTQTTNEYNDQYYALTYPAYWKYDGMGLASTNIGIEGQLTAQTPVTSPPPPNPNGSPISATDKPYFGINFENDLTKYFHLGDELYLKNGTPLEAVESQAIVAPGATPLVNRLWVIGFSSDKSGILLMDKDGQYFNKCEDYSGIPFKIVRSGYRNLQSASMASITLMRNPIKITNEENQTGILDQSVLTYTGSEQFNPRILNASAVVYNDYWKPQSENNLPYYPSPTTSVAVDGQGNPNYPYAVRVNPYLWNIKGDWRAQESYAYLTSRNAATTSVNNPRAEGFFAKFTPFYVVANGLWSTNTNNWTSASSITLYSPYGAELENKDALNRYSAAQYGYNYTLPMAVASNSKYSQMGFEGFEETPNTSNIGEPHFGFDTNDVTYSANHSHTGKKSIKVRTGQSVKLSREMVTAPASIPKETCPSSAGGGEGGNCSFTLTRLGDESCGDPTTSKRIKLTFAANVTATALGSSYVNAGSSPINFNPGGITIDPNNNRIVYVCVLGSFPDGQLVEGQPVPPNSALSYKDLIVTMGNTTCCVRIGCSRVNGSNAYGVTTGTCNN